MVFQTCFQNIHIHKVQARYSSIYAALHAAPNPAGNYDWLANLCDPCKPHASTMHWKLVVTMVCTIIMAAGAFNAKSCIRQCMHFALSKKRRHQRCDDLLARVQVNCRRYDAISVHAQNFSTIVAGAFSKGCCL